MCGIAGIIHFDGRPVDPCQLERMLAAMRYRGPDDSGVFVDGNVGLGHVRLSIIDLSRDGRQPMSSADGDLTLSYNGEIYDYLELKQELATECRFQTKTDTEVLLHAYRKWGLAALHRLNGMFAFAIYDRRNRELHLVRDRFGIKPLYYYRTGETLFFASEPIAILRILDQAPPPDDRTIYDFLVYNRTNHTERSFFEGLRKLQHGHYLRISGAQVTQQPWYRLREQLKPGFPTPAELKESLTSSIELRLRSDVSVGACLSGGLDSSSIVALAAEELGTSLSTFSAAYGEGDHGDETRFIEEFRGRVPEMHYTRPTFDDFFADLDDFVEVMQEPVPGTSGYAEYKVHELAHGHTTVLLNGQGVDEMLAGYLYLAGFYYKELFWGLRWGKLAREMVLDVVTHRSLTGPMAFGYFLLPAQLKDSVSRMQRGYLTPEFARAGSGDETILEELYGAPSLNDALLAHFERKFEHHLVWGDRSSMRFSLELRFPFLDHRFVERALCLSNEQVLRNGVTKVILREAMAGVLPEAIVGRHDKIGYETPEAEWFRQPAFVEFAMDILGSTRFKDRGYVSATRARKQYERHLRGDSDLATEIWKWIHLELWFRKFLDG